MSAEMQVLPVRKFRIVNDWTRTILFSTQDLDEAVERAEELRNANTHDEITILAEVDA
jgi:hypothetical protein